MSWQASKTWKASTDPDFTAKMRRILDLYDNPPADGRVLCLDEFGPLNLQPRPGRARRPAGRPVRLPAAYTPGASTTDSASRNTWSDRRS